jgi:hypothetical protein
MKFESQESLNAIAPPTGTQPWPEESDLPRGVFRLRLHFATHLNRLQTLCVFYFARIVSQRISYATVFKAIQQAVTYKALGGPEVIQFVERTARAPAAGEVRIDVKAAAVNPADILSAFGIGRRRKPSCDHSQRRGSPSRVFVRG